MFIVYVYNGGENQLLEQLYQLYYYSTMSSSGCDTSDSSSEAKSKGKTEICNSCGNYRLPSDIVPNNKYCKQCQKKNAARICTNVK